MPAFEYSEIFDLYDTYCRFAGDVPFWIGEAAGAGRVLELMAGTGRVSLPLLEAGVPLTAIEWDHGMASVLAGKARALGKPSRVLCGDVLRMPIRASFDLVALPFQGLSELAEREQRQTLFGEVAGVLREGGRFVCTAHNPPVRARTLDGDWHEVGTFERDGDIVHVRIRGTLDPQSSIASGEQQITVRRDGGVTREHLLHLRFAIPSLEEILGFALSAGLRIESVMGNYDRAPFDAEASPVIIAVLRGRAGLSGARARPSSPVPAA